MDSEYRADVHDLIVHTPNNGVQRIYRVVSIMLGGLGQEGVIELEPIGNMQADVVGIGKVNALIPHLMFDEMVRRGVIECVWRNC